MIDDCEKRFLAGERIALMEAIYWCIEPRPLDDALPIPDWAAAAFKEAVWPVMSTYTIDSWDSVFGRPHPSRKLDQLRKRQLLEFEIFARVWRLRRQRPKPKDIFQIVADEFGISRPLCKKWFDELQQQIRSTGSPKKVAHLK